MRSLCSGEFRSPTTCDLAGLLEFLINICEDSMGDLSHPLPQLKATEGLGLEDALERLHVLQYCRALPYPAREAGRGGWLVQREADRSSVWAWSGLLRSSADGKCFRLMWAVGIPSRHLQSVP